MLLNFAGDLLSLKSKGSKIVGEGTYGSLLNLTIGSRGVCQKHLQCGYLPTSKLLLEVFPSTWNSLLSPFLGLFSVVKPRSSPASSKQPSTAMRTGAQQGNLN